MLAQGPTCALARVSYMTSTRAKAHNKRYLSGPILHRDMAPFYSAIDTSLFSDKTLQLKLTSKDREEVFFYDLRGLHEVINVIYNDECQFTTQNDSQWQSIWDAPKQYGSAFRSATEVFSRARVCQLQGYEMLCD